MGLTGKLYLDSNIIVYIVERHPRYYAVLLPVLQSARDGHAQLFSSQFSLLECLVLPLRGGNSALAADYHRMLLNSDLTLVPITLEVLQVAATLRAQHVSLRTPDAIHWATARLLGVDSILTNDANFAKVVGSNGIWLESLIGV